LGCVYVLEGSTLGGRVISGQVQARLGAGVTRLFLDGYGQRTGESWQTFRAALAAATRHHLGAPSGNGRSVEGRIIAGAKATFEAFTAWLSATSTR
jgi:heme oxygenase (biliverdin-IX-beta and delta-forming)